MQILGLFGMYFDAVVVEVKKNLLLFRLAMAYNAYIKVNMFFFARSRSPNWNSKNWTLTFSLYFI